MRMFLSLDPPTATAQERKVTIVNGKPVFFKPAKLKAAEEEIILNLLVHKPPVRLNGALELKVKWLFARGRLHKCNEWRITRPDTDNLQKMLKDCMTKVGFWNDDAQVVREVVEKRWIDDDFSGIDIEITELGRFAEGGTL